MKKNYDALRKKLQELEATKTNEVARVEEEIQITRQKIEEAEAKTEGTDNLEEYDKALKEVSYNKGKVKVLSNRLKTLSKTMTDEEFTETQRELLNDFEEIKGSYSAKINAKLQDLLKVMQEYDNDAKELQDLYGVAARLNSRGVNNGIGGQFDPRFIKVEDDPLKWFEGFIRFYYQQEMTLNTLRHLNMI